MRITDKQRDELKNYINGELVDKYIREDDFSSLLMDLDEAMTMTLEGENFKPTKETGRICRLFDAIYAQNHQESDL